MPSIIITFVLVFGWIGVMVGLQMLSGSERSFRDETVQLLEALRDGRTADVHREASPLFRQRVTPDALADQIAELDRTLGTFREILSSKTVDQIDGPGGRTGRISTTLAFEHGRTSGHFSFHWVDGHWRLLGFSIAIPPDLTPAAGGPEVMTAGNAAPDRVLAQFREILEMGRDGEAGRIYDEAAPPFQAAIDRDTFARVLKAREHLLGRYVDIVDTTRAIQNRGRRRAWVTARVRFAKVETTVSMTFMRLDGVWRVSYYKVAIPLPKIPDLASAAP